MPELLTPFMVVEWGMLPVAVTAPNIHKNRPGQPQSNTAATVAMMPVFLLFIRFSSREMNMSEYTFHEHPLQGLSPVDCS
jgi:hypothetical protein